MGKEKKSAERVSVRIRANITATAIEKFQTRARRTGERITIADQSTGGLVLTIGAQRSTYSVAARRPGVDAAGKRYPQRWHVIGDASGDGALTPDAARTSAAAIKLQVRDGIDPTQQRKDAIRERATRERDVEESASARASAIANALDPTVSIALNLSALSEATLDQCREVFELRGRSNDVVSDDYGRARVRHLRMAMAEILDDQSLPIGRLKPSQLRREFVDNFRKSRTKRPVPTNGRIRELRSLMAWLVDQGCLGGVSPLERIAFLKPPRARENQISAEEFQQLWNISDKLPQARADLLKLQILIPGLRRQSVADLRVGWVDLRDASDSDGSSITLPASASKNKRTQNFPLVGEALDIVRRLMKDAKAANKRGEDFLIPLRANGKRFFSWAAADDQIDVLLDPSYIGSAAAKNVRKGLRELREGESLKPNAHIRRHDFRRSFASELGRHEIGDALLLEELLGHGGINSNRTAAAYHVGSRLPRLRPIMLAWDKMISFAVAHGRWPSQAELSSSNVIALQREIA